MSSRTVNSYLADLGARVASDGITAHSGDALVVGDVALAVAPAAATVLADLGQPEVARLRALAVASSAVLRNPAATRSLGSALARVVSGLEPAAAA